MVVYNEEGVLYKNDDDTKIVISSITFAFNNVPLLKLLQQRGKLITSAKYEKISVINSKLKEQIQAQYDQITRPMAAFITFESQEGYERACNIQAEKPLFNIGNANSKVKLLDEPLFFESAPEPTNIIWEHRDMTIKKQQMRKIIVTIAISFIMLLAFISFFILKKQTILN